MEFVAVLHLDFLQPLQGMVMVAYLELHLADPGVLNQDVPEGLQVQDGNEDEVGILQEGHLPTLERLMWLEFLEGLEILHFDRKVP